MPSEEHALLSKDTRLHSLCSDKTDYEGPVYGQSDEWRSSFLSYFIFLEFFLSLLHWSRLLPFLSSPVLPEINKSSKVGVKLDWEELGTHQSCWQPASKGEVVCFLPLQHRLLSMWTPTVLLWSHIFRVLYGCLCVFLLPLFLTTESGPAPGLGGEQQCSGRGRLSEEAWALSVPGWHCHCHGSEGEKDFSMDFWRTKLHFLHKWSNVQGGNGIALSCLK